MNLLPRIPEPPTKLGTLQHALWVAVSSAAVAFDREEKDELDPRRAAVTLFQFSRLNPGLDERQIKRTAQALVARRILKESKIGWCLADEEFYRLERQHLRELQGCYGD